MTPSRILLVEDDAALARGLADALRAEGYEVIAVADGERGMDAALGDDISLILLDIMLPKVNGYEICRAVREAGSHVPIVMLTARGREADAVLGLNLGADDYIVKPFRLAELLARVRACLRRRRQVSSVTRFGPWEVDLHARTVRREGRPVALTTKEYQLLAHFVERPGRALTRDAILDAVWGRSVFVTPRSIDRCVATLRAKIEPDPRRPTYIQTVREIGYRFEPEPAAD